MDWDKLRIFHHVALAGSFTRAVEQLNLSQSAISRQIISLEDTLGVPLFYRHARGLVMSEQGELLFQTVCEVFAKLSLTEALINESQGHPRGPLKITTSVAFGSMWLSGIIKEFLEEYPDIQLQLILRDDEPDLNMREADISIPSIMPNQPDIIAVPLPHYPLRVYASKEYLEKFGVPLKASDLNHHRLIVFGDPDSPASKKVNWLLNVDAKRGYIREPYLSINNVYGILQAVKSGIGIACLNQYVVKDQPNIVEILPDLEAPSVQRYIVYPEQLKHSKRIIVFRKFLEKKMLTAQENPSYTRPL